mmetsp:Transcript_6069/g.18377  ORF Transcript_6069/g.18377 Transcript_6069/m.18377 type:complete len:200 (-) Transcript_6069:2225-2824(-)
MTPSCSRRSHSSVSSGKRSVCFLLIRIESSLPAPWPASASGMILFTASTTLAEAWSSVEAPGWSLRIIVSTYPAPNSSLSSRELPQVARLPRCMIPILSHRISASSIKCVLRMITLSFRLFLMISHVSLLDLGSMPLVGSSRTTSLGLPMKAIPTESLRIWPPLNSQLGQLSLALSPTSWAIPRTQSLIRWRGTPLISA